MKERTAMKRVKTMMFLLMAVMVLFTITPHTAEAAAKKTLTVSVKNAKKTKGKYQLTVKKSAQLVVKYGKAAATSKAKYTVSNKRVATVSKKGKVTAKKAGSVTVTVKYKGKTKKVKFTVKKQAAAKPAAKPAENTSKKPAQQPMETPEAGHEHNWVMGVVTREEWVSDLVKVPDYKEVEVKVYVCGCGEKVYEDVESHKKAHEDAGETYSGYNDTEYPLVEDGYHWEDHGHWGYYQRSEYVCSICKRPMEDD